MKLLIFDTETTGLPKSRESAYVRPDNWPHLVSISWIILDTETNIELKHRYYVIRPITWTIPEDSTKIHGITTAQAMEEGEDLLNVMYEFLKEDCDAWAAHNFEFDMSVLVNAVLWDLHGQFPVTKQRKYCTMRLSKNLCKIPGMYKDYKLPKLKELYGVAFGKPPEEGNLHNSAYDVRILTDIIKTYLPLRQAMGLVVSSVTNTDELVHEGNTLTIRIPRGI